MLYTANFLQSVFLISNLNNNYQTFQWKRMPGLMMRKRLVRFPIFFSSSALSVYRIIANIRVDMVDKYERYFQT